MLYTLTCITFRMPFKQFSPVVLLDGILLPKLSYAVLKQAGIPLRGEKAGSLSDEDLKKMLESYARSYCRMSVDSYIVDQIASDVHSPEVIRVNAILSTVDVFYDVYDVQEGDGMYIAPENRISRWH